jgi:undecaprenyl-diphosphatase
MSALFLKTIKWLGSRGGLFLFAVLVVVAGVWGFVALADEMLEGDWQRTDMRVNRFVHDHPGPPWLQEAGRDVTALGGVTVLALWTMAVLGFLLLSRRYGMMVLVIIATLGGLALTLSLKRAIDRPRPPERQASVIVYTQSFPSGHTMLSATVYLTLGGMLARTVRGRLLKFYFLSLALGLTFLIGMSRVYLGAHYPSDVLAGWCGGLVWAILCWLVARELQRRRVVEEEGETGEQHD